jgi:twinkle protein
MVLNISELKESVKLEDIVSQTTKLNRVAHGFVGKCPLHNEKSPSFNIYTKTNRYKCFGCGKSGTNIDFFMETQGIKYIDAVEAVAKFGNFDLEYDNKNIEKPIPRLTKVSNRMLDYFENKRKISNYTLLRFGITESVEWGVFSKKNVDVICFNYFRNGELVNIKFRGIDEKKDMLMSKGSELIFYNLDAIKDNTECVITEGEIDCLSLYESGVYNAISVPNGAAQNLKNNLKYVDNCYDYFTNKKKIIIAVDNDSAGIGLKNSLIAIFGIERCFVAKLPDDCKDSNDVLVKYGKEKLKECIDKAIAAKLEFSKKEVKELKLNSIINEEDDNYSFIQDESEIEEKLQLIRDGKNQLGLTTGMKLFDEYFLFKENNLNLTNGHDNVGKSAVTWYLALLSAMYHNWNWVIFSSENTNEGVMRSLIQFYAGKPIYGDYKMNDIEYKEAKQFVKNHFTLIDTDSDYYSYEDILVMIKKLQKIKKYHYCLIDPYNSLRLPDSKDMPNTHDYHYAALSKMRIFIKQNNIGILLNNHAVTSALRMRDGDKKYPVAPQKADTEGGGKFANRADDFLTIHRALQHPTQYMITEIHVRKIKDTETGGRVTPFDSPYKMAMYNRMCGFREVIDVDTNSIHHNYGIDPVEEWHKIKNKQIEIQFTEQQGLTEEQLSAFD